MDQSTSKIRSQQWKSIIEACTSRPAGITAKQWLEDNNIPNKSYYYWLRKFRKESYETITTTSLTAVSETSVNEVTFAEVPFQPQNEITIDNDTTVIQPVAVIKNSSTNIAITNDISPELLHILIQEVTHA